MLEIDSTFEVPRVHRPSRRDFEDRFLNARRPVILTGVVDQWPAYQKWTNEYLKAKSGDRTVRVSKAHEGAHFYGGKESMIDYAPMKFGEYVDLVATDSIGDGRLYAHNIAFQKQLPDLFPDFTMPPYFDAERVVSINFWFGAGNNLTPLHYDASYNFLSMVRGMKQVLLCPPEAITHLYAFPVNYASHHFSQVNVAKPDLSEFPDFARAERSLVEVKAGETLFIPFFWWHGVYSVDQNIAVNVWWSVDKKLYLRYPRQAARAAGRGAYLELRGAAKKLQRGAGS